MRRLFSLLGSCLLGVALLIGAALPLRSALAVDACQFTCRVTLGAGAQNCNPRSENGIPTVEYTPCNTQCQRTCASIGMAFDTSQIHASTCQTTNGSSSQADRCSPCSCIPNTAIACTDASEGGSSSQCTSQCGTTCSAVSGRVRELQGAGSGITCATGINGTPQCVNVTNPRAATQICRACMTACINDTTGDVQRSPNTCYTTCQRADHQAACVGTTAVDAGVPQVSPTTGGTTQPSPGGTGSSGAPAPAGSGTAPSTGSTGSGSTGSGSTPASTDGVCKFTCQPPVEPTTCNVDADCATPCQQICGRSFRNGQCSTTNGGAACRPVGAGGAKQCVFECSIGTSTQERSCNPQGTDAQAPTRVCGSFCEQACRDVSTQTGIPSTARFCQGSAPLCSPNGSGSSGSTGTGSGGGSDSSGSGSSINSDGSVSLGTGSGGTRLQNPLPGIDSIAGLVGRIIKGILGVVGSVALLMFVYGGIKWILSAGDAKEVAGAQNILRNAVIGMLLIFFSYTISSVILGLFEEVGGGNTTTQTTGTNGPQPLATCVEYAVSHGFLGRNEAQDSTAPNWSCRQTQASERTDRSRCITRGCPNDGPTVLCCAPVTSGSGSAGGGSGTTSPAAATVGCRTTVGPFTLRPTATDSTGVSISAVSTQVQVTGVGTVVRGDTLIHQVRVVSGTTALNQVGWMFLTRAQVTACTVPAS